MNVDKILEGWPVGVPLVLLGGPSTGKTTLAKKIAERVQLPLVSWVPDSLFNGELKDVCVAHLEGMHWYDLAKKVAKNLIIHEQMGKPYLVDALSYYFIIETYSLEGIEPEYVIDLNKETT